MRVGAEPQTLERILRKYYESLYSNTFDNLDETDKFLRNTNSQGLLTKKWLELLYIDSRNCIYSLRHLSINNNNNSNNNPSAPDGFSVEFYHIFKEEKIPVPYNLSRKIEDEGILPYSFYEASITLVLKSDKDVVLKKHPVD